MQPSEIHECWCVLCGRDVDSNTGWFCDDCKTWTCLSCHHRCSCVPADATEEKREEE